MFSIRSSCVRGALALLLIVSLMTALIPAYADSVRLSSMTDDEILKLLSDINNELVRRGIPRTATLPKGAYIAGETIPCGSYIYTCLAQGDDWGNLTVYSERGKGKQLLWHVVGAPDDGEEPETVFITLNEGDELKSGVPFSLTIMTGISFR
ncbi:MAG: hypothetical protein IKS31_02060 [Clostridia bacterium]|nr:hypothetical protein [Clostridia bacterium]